MNSGNSKLDSLFNSLPSVYRTDAGMQHSTLFAVFKADAEVLGDVQRKLDQVRDNTYIATADSDALEANFGLLVDFPKPPRLNTLSNGDDIYRAMLKSFFRVFQSGATTGSMKEAITTATSYLTTDPSTADSITVTNYTHLLVPDTSITLTWPAIQTGIGATVVGPATPSDISFFPADIIPVAYDDINQIVSFTGTINTGTLYQVVYSRDNGSFNGTNWINTSDQSILARNPFNLRSDAIPTYDNPIFSYWWSTFNADGEGVIIDEFKLAPTESDLVWRLPEKTIEFVSPFTGQVLTRTTDFYNLSGTVYDIEHLDSVNIDTLFTDIPSNYYTDVSPIYTNYYIRYSANNNGPNAALSQFNGSLNKFTKKYGSVVFPSDNFGQLDFFEKGSGFDPNDIFGSGTKNIWLNVPNKNSAYILSNDTIYERTFSLHEKILYDENFESGKLNRIQSTYLTGTLITDLVGVPLDDKNDCLMLMSQSSGTLTIVNPLLSNEAISTANRVSVDFFDSLNSGTQTLIDVTRTGTTNHYNRFRFGIDSDIIGFEYTTTDPLASSKNFGFVETYFNNNQSIDRALNVASYTLITGTNPNVQFSDVSMFPGDFPFLASQTMTANASNSLISNSDRLVVQYNTTAATYGISISMENYRNLGNYLGTPMYGTDTITLSEQTNGFDRIWVSTISKAQLDPNTGLISHVNLGSPSFILNQTGTTTVEIVKGVGTILNGTTYTNELIFNPGTLWGNLGTANGDLSTIIAGSQSNIRIQTKNTDAYYHFSLQNDALKTQFLNTLSTQSGFLNSTVPYFYQIFTNPNNVDVPKTYLNQFPRREGWGRLIFDFGTSYTGTTAMLDESVFYNSPIGFSGTLISSTGLALTNISSYPDSEFSYFDNIKLSYFDADQTLPQYQLKSLTNDDWQGSALNQNTILDNKYFELDPQPNFQFSVNVKGLDESFIHVVSKIINKIKPEHTIVTSIFESDQFLDTTEAVPLVSNPATNWESGNINSNTIILPLVSSSDPSNDKIGAVSISGNI